MTALLDAIDLIEREEERFDHGFPLPEVVVVGDQSDGKSTLLEAISGVQLPKGSGICTLCPIKLCIRASEAESASIALPGKTGKEVVESLSELEGRLRRAQEALSGEKKFSREPIIVEVHGPNLPNLSVVDLPGINRKTEQTEEEIVSLIDEWIAREETIILVVAKATNDIASSKGYQMARKVDPEKKRTHLVMTNCDGSLVNKEDDIKALFKEGDRTLFAVNCFRPKNSTVSSEQLIEQEARFFAQHELFKHFPRNTGTANLVKSLEDMLCEKIAPYRQKIMAYAANKVKQLETELTQQESLKERIMSAADSCIFKIRQEFLEQVTGSDRRRPNSLYHRCEQVWITFGNQIRKKSDDLRNNLPNKIQEENEQQRGREPEQLINYFPVMERIIAQLVESFEPEVDRVISETQQLVHEALVEILIKHMQKSETLKLLAEIESKITIFVNNELMRFQDESRELIVRELKKQKIVFYSSPKIYALVRAKFNELPSGIDMSQLTQPRKPPMDRSNRGAPASDGAENEQEQELEREQSANEHIQRTAAENGTAADVDATTGLKSTPKVEFSWKNLVSWLASFATEYLKMSGTFGGLATPDVLSKFAEQYGIPLWLAKVALTFLQMKAAAADSTDSEDRDFQKWVDDHSVFCLTYVYIDVVCDRTADAIPMAIAYFFNQRLETDICHLIPQIRDSEVEKLFEKIDMQRMKEIQQDRLESWNEIKKRLVVL